MADPVSTSPVSTCPVCGAEGAPPHRDIDSVRYFDCQACGSLFADPEFIAAGGAATPQSYDEAYWVKEVRASKRRSIGASINRAAELFYYARRPIERFIDIGAGTGRLIDSLSELLPELRDTFHAVEAFPPPQAYRSPHENYHVGALADLSQKFDAGVCIEVIEHLTPDQLDGLVQDLAARSNEQAIYFFNSGQPDFVKAEDPAYLDPHGRGHIIAYSLKGLRPIFERHDFSILALPGRAWGFLAEYKSQNPADDADALLNRLWTAREENMTALNPTKENMLAHRGYGPLIHAIGLESARCYLEAAQAEARTRWALSLQAELEAERRR